MPRSFWIKRDWSEKPDVTDSIDWANPITKGLNVALIYNGGFTDLVSGKPATPFLGAHLTPDGVEFNNSNYLILPNVTLGPNYSILFNNVYNDNAGTSFQYFFSFGNWAQNNTINLYLSESDIAADVKNTLRAYSQSLLDAVTLWPSIDAQNCGFVAESQSAQWYVGGASESATSSFGTSAMAPGTTRDLFIGGRTDLNADRFFNGTQKYLYIFDDVVSADTFAAINDNPWQIFKRDPQRVIFDMGAVTNQTLTANPSAQRNITPTVTVAQDQSVSAEPLVQRNITPVVVVAQIGEQSVSAEPSAQRNLTPTVSVAQEQSVSAEPLVQRNITPVVVVAQIGEQSVSAEPSAQRNLTPTVSVAQEQSVSAEPLVQRNITPVVVVAQIGEQGVSAEPLAQRNILPTVSVTQIGEQSLTAEPLAQRNIVPTVSVAQTIPGSVSANPSIQRNAAPNALIAQEQSFTANPSAQLNITLTAEVRQGVTQSISALASAQRNVTQPATVEQMQALIVNGSISASITPSALITQLTTQTITAEVGVQRNVTLSGVVSQTQGLAAGAAIQRNVTGSPFQDWALCGDRRVLSLKLQNSVISLKPTYQVTKCL